MSGFSQPEDLHFVYVRGRMIFFGYYDQCTRYIEQFVKTSWLISSRNLGDECPIVAYHSEKSTS